MLLGKVSYVVVFNFKRRRSVIIFCVWENRIYLVGRIVLDDDSCYEEIKLGKGDDVWIVGFYLI